MGIAETVPGVSGSTLALVMRIYSDFISFLYQVSDFLKELISLLIFRSNYEKLKIVFKKINFVFGFFLFLGMAVAILIFSNLITHLLENYREFVLAFFFGLVLASVSVPWERIKEKTSKEVLLFFVSFVLVFLLLSLTPHSIEGTPSPFYFFLSGSIAICAMVLPGISGSFVFLMLGVYEFIMNYLSNLTRLDVNTNELLSLLALFLGIIFGFSIFVRVLKHALAKHASIIFAILTGIILASLRVLWPYYEVVSLVDVIALSSVAVVGFGTVFFLKKLG